MRNVASLFDCMGVCVGGLSMYYLLLQKLTAQFSSIAETSIDPELDKTLMPPEWLTTDQQQRSPYLPQIGDEVMYFFQGHRLYVEEVRKIELYEIKNLPWDKIPNLRVSFGMLSVAC